MCGRYTMTVDVRTAEKRFGARFVSGHFEATYNAAPSQMLPIIRTHRPDRIELAQWGFWPEGWKRSTKMRPPINARIDTADEKRMFHDSFHSRHCMVLADGYYEWRQVGTRKQPYRITLKTREPFAMAGIYARSSNHQIAEAENVPVNFAILTTAANDAVRPFHHRMPVMLPLGRERKWLVPRSGMIVDPFPSELMSIYPVSPKMNRPTFNEPAAIVPVEPVIQ